MFGESQKAIDNRAKRLQSKVGAHAVYMAALEDPKLKDKLQCNGHGTVRYVGRNLSPMAYASILIYLSGKYGIRPTEYELRSGLLGAARRGAPVSEALDPMAHEQEVKRRELCAKWLKENPGPFPTETIGKDLFPEEWFGNQRCTEMAISGTLKALGLSKHRRRIAGLRTYVWLRPTDPGAEESSMEIYTEQLVKAIGKPNKRLAKNDPPVVIADGLPDVADDMAEEPVSEMDPLSAFDDDGEDIASEFDEAIDAFDAPNHSTPFDEHEDQDED